MRFILILLILISFNAFGKTEILREMESTSNESKIQFITRVATYMDSWTKRNDVEACGHIIQLGDIYAVIIETQRKREECLSSQSYKGWTMTGETIHSHPHRRKTKASAFSDTDYATPGYLIDSGELWYQNGKGTEELHAYH